MPSVWFAFAILIGITEAVAAKPAIDAVPAKKFLLFKFNFCLFLLNILYLELKNKDIKNLIFYIL